MPPEKLTSFSGKDGSLRGRGILLAVPYRFCLSLRILTMFSDLGSGNHVIVEKRGGALRLPRIVESGTRSVPSGLGSWCGATPSLSRSV